MRVRDEPDTVQLSKITLKKRTHAALKNAAGRSPLNTEISRWLDATARDVELLDAMLALVFGEGNAPAVLAFGRILRDQSMFAEYGGPPDWQSDDNQFETVLSALRLWLEREVLRHASKGDPDEERADRFSLVASLDEKVRRSLGNARALAAKGAGDGADEE